MSKFTYEITIPGSGTYEVGSDKELTDAQAYKFALQQATPAIKTEKPKSTGIVDRILRAGDMALTEGVNRLAGAGETALTLGTAATGGIFGTIGGGVSEAIDQYRSGNLGTGFAKCSG